MHWNRSLKPQIWAVVYIIASRLWVPTNCLVEGIGIDPVNTLGFQLSEISVPQYLLFILVFLELVLLYTLGILPLEFDFSSVFANKGLDATLKNDTRRASVGSPNRVCLSNLEKFLIPEKIFFLKTIRSFEAVVHLCVISFNYFQSTYVHYRILYVTMTEKLSVCSGQ
jgi:hypothetical protein